MIEKLIKIFQLIGSAVAVIGIFGGFLYSTGWIISESQAQKLIDASASLVATQAAQAVIDEAKAREMADLQFQKAPLVEKIKELLDTTRRSGGEEFELQEAQKELDRINARLDELQK